MPDFNAQLHVNLSSRVGCRPVRSTLLRVPGLCGALAAVLVMGGCAGVGSSGPGASKVASAQGTPLGDSQIAVMDLTDDVAKRIIASHKNESFGAAFGDSLPSAQVIGEGDVLDISIWEAPPATLFGGSGGEGSSLAGSVLEPRTAVNSSLPPQMVMQSGTISIPFVGEIRAAGLSTQQLERAIVAGLRGKAHSPQVLVRVAANRSAAVTVVGDVANSTMIPLTSKGERLLDALAGSGGVKQATNKTTIRLTRGEKTVSQPLEAVLLDPAQNIYLRPGDVLTVLHKPFAFVALGAVRSNTEIPFESTGLTLAQALARAGGLEDNRADMRGVFIFRLETPEALAGLPESLPPQTPDGRIPVIYKVDLSDPRSFFIAQGFPIRDGDVLYVSNARLADLQKFVSIISSMAFSIIGVSRAVE